MKRVFTLLITLIALSHICLAQIDYFGPEKYGRLYNLSYHPTIENKVYAITLGNHILSSDNNGVDWNILYSHPQMISSLHLLPSINALSFALTADETIFYILDLETNEIINTFQAPSADADSEWVIEYSVLESNTDIALIAQGYSLDFISYSKVYLTTDGGQKWEELYYSGDNLDISVNNVAINPADESQLFILRGEGKQDKLGGLLISSDEGHSWNEQIEGIALYAIEFNPDDTSEILIGSFIGYKDTHSEGVYHSTDAARSFKLIDIRWSDYILNNINLIKYNPTNTEQIAILEENEFLLSNDGGATWDINVYPDSYDNILNYNYGLDISFNPFKENEFLISCDYYPFKTSDGGNTLSLMETSFFVTSGHVNYFEDTEQSDLIFGIQGGYIHHDLNTDKRTEYNVSSVNEFFSESSLFIMDKKIAGRLYSLESGWFGSTLSYSDDLGVTQNVIAYPFGNNINVIESAPDNSNLIWFSVDYGADASVLQIADFSDINSVSITDISLPQSYGSVFGTYIEDAKNVTITQGGRVYKTIDSGVTWTDSSIGLTNFLDEITDVIFGLAVNPFNENQLAIASSQGIFISSDAGYSWSSTSITSPVHNIAFSSETDGQIVSTSHSSNYSSFNIYVLPSAAEEWVTIENNELNYIKTNHLFGSTDFNFESESIEIFIGSTDLGLLKYKYSIDPLDEDVSIPLSIEHYNKNSVIAYPNPTYDQVYIDAKEEVISVEVINISGQHVLSSDRKEINLTKLEKGIYILEVKLANGESFTNRIIKK